MDQMDSKEKRGHEADTWGHVQGVTTRGIEQEDAGTVQDKVGRVEHITIETPEPNC